MGQIRYFGLSLFLIGVPLFAQQVKFVDLTVAPQRVHLRYPPTLPTQRGGVGSAAVADCGIGARDPRSLTVYLQSVIAEDSDPKRPFEVEFKVMNTGKVPLQLPVSPNLSDLQPHDASARFDYLALALSVSIVRDRRSEGYVQLYGKADVPGTIITLNPGEWLRIEAKPDFHENLPPTGVVDLKPGHWLQRVTIYPHPGGYSMAAVNICMPEGLATSVPVRRN